MIHFPVLPNWNGFHPLIIHFPIALLLVVPLFIAVGALLPPRHSRSFLLSALVLMILGTASVFFSVETGEAARGVTVLNPAIQAALNEHQELAEVTEVLFSVLTIAFASLLFLPHFFHVDLGRPVNLSLLAVFLIFYTTGILFLVNTAHRGGMLVHEMGVRARVSQQVSASAQGH